MDTDPNEPTPEPASSEPTTMAEVTRLIDLAGEQLAALRALPDLDALPRNKCACCDRCTYHGS